MKNQPKKQMSEEIELDLIVRPDGTINVSRQFIEQNPYLHEILSDMTDGVEKEELNKFFKEGEMCEAIFDAPEFEGRMWCG